MPVEIESTAANAAPTPGVGSAVAQGVDSGMSGGIGGVVSGLFGTAMNWIEGNPITQSQKEQDQLTQQGKLDAQQLGYNEQATDYGEQTQQKLWNGTNSIALADEAAQEGYNPALIYGGGGGGGATGAGITGVSAPQASTAAEQTGAQAAEQNAENQTVNAGSNAAQTAANIQQTAAVIPSIIQATKLAAQQTGNAAIAGQGMQLDNTFKAIQNGIATGTEQEQIDLVGQNLALAKEQLTRIGTEVTGQDIENSIKSNAMTAIVAQYNEQLKLTIAQIIQTHSSTALNIADATAIAQRITIGYKELAMQARGQQVSSDNMDKLTSTMLKGALIGAGAQLVGTALKAYLAPEGTIPDVNTNTQSTTYDSQGNVTGGSSSSSQRTTK